MPTDIIIMSMIVVACGIAGYFLKREAKRNREIKREAERSTHGHRHAH